MSQDNRISAAIDAKAQGDVTDAITNIKNNLATVLVFNLTPQQRLEMSKMGDKTLAFVDNALTYAEQNPTLVPNFVDVAEARKDYVLARDLNSIYQQMVTVLRSIEDTMMIAGSEAYDASLIFYNSVKGATKSNAPGAQAVFNDLRQRFPKGGLPKPAAKNTNPPA